MVLAVLAAKTGYEPDMIEMDMALETELGVDSIKRVEILSDVQKELNVEAQDVAALSRTQTVGEVVEAKLMEQGGAGAAPGAALDLSAGTLPVSSAVPLSSAMAHAIGQSQAMQQQAAAHGRRQGLAPVRRPSHLHVRLRHDDLLRHVAQSERSLYL